MNSQPVKINTAFTAKVGPVLDAAGAFVADCVISDFKIAKAGGDFAALNASATRTYEGHGIYDIAGTTSDANTPGDIVIKVDDASGANNSMQLWRGWVFTASAFDNLFGSAAALLTEQDLENAVVNGNTTYTTPTLAQIQQAPSDALTAAGLTSARAGYLDNLNVGGLVASSSEVTAIQNNTRVVRVVPEIIETPAAGTRTYRIELLLYDSAGNMETPDSAPTITLVNNAGADRSARLDSTTMTLVSAGRYRAVYTATAGDAREQLVWVFSVVEGGQTRAYGNSSWVTDTVASDFTTADRTKLDDIFAKLPSKSYLAGTANSDGDVQLDEATGALTATAVTEVLNVIGALNDLDATQTQAACAAAMAAIFLDKLFAAAYDPATKPGDAAGLLNQIIENDAGASRFTAESLELAPTGGGGSVTLDQTERNAIASTVFLLSDSVELGVNLQLLLRTIGAIISGNVEGANTALEKFFAFQNPGTKRVEVVTDIAGNRTSVTTF